MKKLKILIDVDGVVADFVGRLLAKLKQKHEIFVNRWHITHWDFFSKPNETFDTKTLTIIWKMFNSSGFVKYLQPIYYSKQKIQELHNQGHSIIWVTAQHKTSKTWCFDRFYWIEKYFGHISNRIIFTWEKELIGGDIFIDD